MAGKCNEPAHSGSGMIYTFQSNLVVVSYLNTRILLLELFPGTLTPNTFKRPHLQVPSPWELGFQHEFGERDKNIQPTTSLSNGKMNG